MGLLEVMSCCDMTCLLLFLSDVDNYMILMSLLTRFCLFRAPIMFTEENEPKPYKLIPQFSVPIVATILKK